MTNIFFNETKSKGRKPHLFMVLDCETATLPFINEWKLTPKQKQAVAIAKPLIYDIGWQIIDRTGKVYAQHSYLINETFFVPNVFNTAYYRDKRPIYMDRLEKGEIERINWFDMIDILLADMERVQFVGAYNSMFDFKKAIPFTEKYLTKLYSNDYQEWEDRQRYSCKSIINGSKWVNPEEFDNMHFNFREKDYPMIDLWGLACTKLINEDTYKKKCLEMSMISPSGLFFKTSAETTFRFLIEDYDFIEEHTALGDVEIESQILVKALKKGKVDQGILYFPFRELGETVDFCCDEKNLKFIDESDIQNIIDTMWVRLTEGESYSPFATQLQVKVCRLERIAQKYFKKQVSEQYKICDIILNLKKIKKKVTQQNNLNFEEKAWWRVEHEIKRIIVDIEKVEGYKQIVIDFLQGLDQKKHEVLIEKINKLMDLELPRVMEEKTFSVTYLKPVTEDFTINEKDVREYYELSDNEELDEEDWEQYICNMELSEYEVTDIEEV